MYCPSRRVAPEINGRARPGPNLCPRYGTRPKHCYSFSKIITNSLFFLYLNGWWDENFKQMDKDNKTNSASGNRTPSVGVRDRNPNHWTNADMTETYLVSLCHLHVSLANLKMYQYLPKLHVRIGPVVRISRFHRDGRGSNPRCGACFVLRNFIVWLDDSQNMYQNRSGPCRGLNPGPLPP